MPYWRLSSYYFIYFASLGALIPYWGLYLKSLDFSAQQIGELMAVVMATKLFSPVVWGWIADHTGRRMMIIRIGGFLSALAFYSVVISNVYFELMLSLLAFSFFWNATLPQFEVTTLNHLDGEHHHYSTIRLWGSVGFILSVVMLGWALEWTGVAILPLVLLVIFSFIWIVSLIVPEKKISHPELNNEELRHILKRPEVISLLLASFMMQVGHGTYYSFYTLYMEDFGYSSADIGQLWALGVVSEVAIFLIMHRLIPNYGLKPLLKFSLVIAAVRWGLIAEFPEQTWLMIIAQIMHAATFGIFHSAAISLIYMYFPGKHQGKGQALYSSISFGAGGALGALYSGYIWDTWGQNIIFISGMIVSVLGWSVLSVTQKYFTGSD